MDRREALKTTSFVIGYTLSASAIATTIQSCHTEPAGHGGRADDAWTPAFFNQNQLKLLAELTETLMPETTTPGAKSVHVHRFIDDEIQSFYSPLEQYRFLQGLDDVQARAHVAHGKTFEACTMDERMVLLTRLAEETENAEEAGKIYGESFFKMLKAMTFHGYFTSEKIGKEVLAFDPIPGIYQGCIPLEEVGKLWSI